MEGWIANFPDRNFKSRKDLLYKPKKKTFRWLKQNLTYLDFLLSFSRHFKMKKIDYDHIIVELDWSGGDIPQNHATSYSEMEICSLWCYWYGSSTTSFLCGSFQLDFHSFAVFWALYYQGHLTCDCPKEHFWIYLESYSSLNKLHKKDEVYDEFLCHITETSSREFLLEVNKYRLFIFIGSIVYKSTRTESTIFTFVALHTA